MTRAVAARDDTCARRWVVSLLAVVIAALAAVLLGTTTPAHAAGLAEKRVRASTSVIVVHVLPPEHIPAGQRLGEAVAGPQIVVATGVAAKTGDEFVDLASTSRRTHILDGDATGGGHLWPGLPGKTPFPKDWSADRVMHEISDVATDPSSIFRSGRGGSTIATGTRSGVDIKVVLRGGQIITGHPMNLSRNPW